MAIVFVGGARDSGKTAALKKFCKFNPRAKHISLPKLVKESAPDELWGGKKKSLRILSQIEQQKAVVSAIYGYLHTNRDGLLLVEGNFLSCCKNKPGIYFTIVQPVAHNFNALFLVKTHSKKIVHRRLSKGKKGLPQNMVENAQTMEAAEARFLSMYANKPLIECNVKLLPKALRDNYSHLL